MLYVSYSILEMTGRSVDFLTFYNKIVAYFNLLLPLNIDSSLTSLIMLRFISSTDNPLANHLSQTFFDCFKIYLGVKQKLAESLNILNYFHQQCKNEDWYQNYYKCGDDGDGSIFKCFSTNLLLYETTIILHFKSSIRFLKRVGAAERE